MSPKLGGFRGSASDPTRRSVLAMVTGGLAVGLAGCSGNGNENGDGDGDGNDGDTLSPTTAGSEDGSQGTTTDGADGSQGSAPESRIPGEVVHDGLENIVVLEHWTERDFIMLRIRNEGEDPLSAQLAISSGDRIIRGRVLTEEGNVIRSHWWNGSEGPEPVNPGTEAEIGFLATAEEGDRYELCLGVPEVARESWEDMCG